MYQLNLDKNHKYLLACSYGPDSMALFHLLQNQGYDFECAIVNYHLRKESYLEVEGLLNYASKFSIKIHVLDVKQNIIKNVEAECRKIRYQFFKDLTDKYGYYATLIAHHQDDKIETFLLQKERQNCPIYFGISEKTVINGTTILRPLLPYSKQELLDICKQNNVPYSVDKTNFDISIKRNKIRHEFVAKLSQPKRKTILKQIDDCNKSLNDMFTKLENLDLTKVANILSLNKLEQSYALNNLLKKYGIKTSLSKENVGEIIKILISNKPNGEFKIKNNLYLIKEYDEFILKSHKYTAAEYAYTILKPSKIDTPYFFLDFTKEQENRSVNFKDYPLTIRNLRGDDEILINDYKVTANRLMIDWKVPYRVRLSWPVIVNSKNECIYIPRYRKDFKLTKDLNFYVKPIR